MLPCTIERTRAQPNVISVTPEIEFAAERTGLPFLFASVGAPPPCDSSLRRNNEVVSLLTLPREYARAYLDFSRNAYIGLPSIFPLRPPRHSRVICRGNARRAEITTRLWFFWENCLRSERFPQRAEKRKVSCGLWLSCNSSSYGHVKLLTFPLLGGSYGINVRPTLCIKIPLRERIMI